MRSMSRVLCVLLLAIAGSAQAAVTTRQGANSQIDDAGITQALQTVSTIDGFASSQAIWPPADGGPQARTAARSRAAEIAVNARVFSPDFRPGSFDLALSQAVFAIEAVSPSVQRGAFDFFLPPSYVELVTNAEIPWPVLETVMFADVRACFTSSCGSSDQRFYFQANLTGSYTSYSHTVTASGDPGLDLTPLRNPTLVEETGFVRTVRLEFPEFTGHIDLGVIPANATLRIEYLMQARAWGDVGFSSAIAAINDPFALDTDPVQAGRGLNFLPTPVPEPQAWLLLLAGIGVLAACSRLRESALRSAAVRA